MRGSFNAVSVWFFGPQSSAGTPDAVRAVDVPCRGVPQLEIDQLQFPFTFSQAWVTLDAFEPNGPTVLTPERGFTWENYWAADQVIIDRLGLVRWLVCRCELVAPVGRAAYWRALLVDRNALLSPPWPPPEPLPPPVPPPLPPPPPPPPEPGPTCADAGPIELGQTCVGILTLGELTFNWFKMVLDEGEYHVDFASIPGHYPESDVRLQVFVGPCDNLDPLLVSLQTGGCETFSVDEETPVLIRIYSPIWDDASYSFVLDVGPCVE